MKPVDNVPSCPPVTNVVNICDKLNSDINPDELYNTISWTNPQQQCPEIAEDIVSFNIYYAETVDKPLVKIASQDVSERYSKIHYPQNGLLGCYAVTAVDNLGNESIYSNIECVDNCPFYELPNTFTPNGDGGNDAFIPSINLFIGPVWWPDMPGQVNQSRFRKMWLELQQELTKLSSASRQVFADQSSHFIQFDQPALVIDAIRQMVAATRQTSTRR